MDEPQTAVATLVGILGSLGLIFRGIGAFFGWLTARAQKRRMLSVPPTAGHVPGERHDPIPGLEVALEDHYRRLLQAERDRTAKLEADLHEKTIEADALRRELAECDKTSASLASETTAKTYALETANRDKASLAAENDELRASIAAGTHEQVVKKKSSTRLRVIEVNATARSTDPPPSADIHSAPTPKPGRNPIT